MGDDQPQSIPDPVTPLVSDVAKLRELRAELENRYRRAALGLATAARERRALAAASARDAEVISSVDCCIGAAEMALRQIVEGIEDITRAIAAAEARVGARSPQRDRQRAAEQSELLAARLAQCVAALNAATPDAPMGARTAGCSLTTICQEISSGMSRFIAELRVYAAQLRTA